MEIASEVAIILAGVSSLVVATIYALRHIKESTCCGSRCTQVVVDDPCPLEAEES